MNWTGWHFGRSFGGAGHLEESCPCPKAPCGLVVMNEWDPECLQHPPERVKTIRSSHAPEDCPELCRTEDGTAAETVVQSVMESLTEQASELTFHQPLERGVRSALFATALELTRRAAAQAHGTTVDPGSIHRSWSLVFANSHPSPKTIGRNIRIHVLFDTLTWE